MSISNTCLLSFVLQSPVYYSINFYYSGYVCCLNHCFEEKTMLLLGKHSFSRFAGFDYCGIAW